MPHRVLPSRLPGPSATRKTMRGRSAGVLSGNYAALFDGIGDRASAYTRRVAQQIPTSVWLPRRVGVPSRRCEPLRVTASFESTGLRRASIDEGVLGSGPGTGGASSAEPNVRSSALNRGLGPVPPVVRTLGRGTTSRVNASRGSSPVSSVGPDCHRGRAGVASRTPSACSQRPRPLPRVVQVNSPG